MALVYHSQTYAADIVILESEPVWKAHSLRSRFFQPKDGKAILTRRKNRKGRHSE